MFKPTLPLCRQLTLGLLKPDLCANPLAVSQIHKRIQEAKFEVVESRDLVWTKAEAEKFYGEHKGKFFFERLVGYMTSGPFQALILSKDNAIKDWRGLIGPTHPVRAAINAPDTLRSIYGLTDTRNSFHGSDSDETAKREIEIFFPEFDVDQWRAKETTSTS
ncbi:nucleoside diphosphate kinase [Basidiobolus meristosporus CBS 931.73]|uniref:Nucleoside diphosphate kinase n=1 Tax=Basidiobolus meristosporus CBS 931.73 TaxID=1314790 RepID=A0A1Y1YG05_9FUNG|nr:nucleoside diphosphate kinase [Basidiobolus meristosporus CBS 931.73]|eukprot:ORX96823.1 nucleoside diphosphate kinase [Basidiobolus meristosporus CBS 931.73]